MPTHFHPHSTILMSSVALGRIATDTVVSNKHNGYSAVQLQDSTCHFFRKPRELRDEIYKYALSESHGLFYIYTESDITFNCIPPPKPRSLGRSLRPTNWSISIVSYVMRILGGDSSWMTLHLSKTTYPNQALGSNSVNFNLEISMRKWEEIGRPKLDDEWRHIMRLIYDYCFKYPKTTLHLQFAHYLDSHTLGVGVFICGSIPSAVTWERDVSKITLIPNEILKHVVRDTQEMWNLPPSCSINLRL